MANPEKFPCPNCGATDGWSAQYIRPAYQGVTFLEMIDGVLEPYDYRGDEDLYDDCGEDEYYTCACGHSVDPDGRTHDPKALAAITKSDLVAMLRRLLEETPLQDEEDGAHDVIDAARALLAQVTP